MSDAEFDARMGDLGEGDISEPVHGVGNVVLALFHWVFALQYLRASEVLRVLLASDAINKIQK